MNKIKILINRAINFKYLDIVILVAIIIFAFAIRLYKLQSPLADWHSWRQADTASVSRIYFDNGINLLYPRYYDISSAQSGILNPQGFRFVEFPVFNICHTLLAKMITFITFDASGRLVSIFCSLLTTVFLYLIGRNLMGKWGGVLSAFFYAFLPFNIYFTRVVLPEPMAVMFSVGGLYFFTRFYRNGRYLLFYISALMFALALLLKPYTFFYMIPVAILLLKKYTFYHLLKNPKMYVFVFIVTAPFIIWRMWIGRYPEGIPFWKWAFNGDNIRFRPAFWRWIFGERLGRMILGIWGMVPFSYAIIAYKREKALVHYLLIGAFVYVSLIATANVRHDYYQTLIIPVIAIALAYGTIELWMTKYFSRLIVRTLLVFSLFLMMGIGIYTIKDLYLVNHPEIVTAGQEADKLLPKDALVVAPYNGDTAFLYQTKRFGWPVIDLPFEEIVALGADYYISVNYDDLTNELISKYQVLVRNKDFVIIKLN